MKPWVIVTVIVSVVVGVILLTCIGGGIFLYSKFGPPKNIEVEITFPEQIIVDEEFEFHVRIHNTASRVQTLDSIDIANRLFDWLDIDLTNPAARGPYEIPFDNTISFDFQGYEIPAHDSIIVTFHATPWRVGRVSSYMDVCINSPVSFLTEHFDFVIEEAVER